MPTPGEWIRRLGTLPLMYQPGEQWLYSVGSDVLGVLIARAAGQPFETFPSRTIFDPLGMTDTGWDGGLGTIWRADPSEGMTTILMTQRAWRSPAGPPTRSAALGWGTHPTYAATS
jgi:CubicO group peptidase (beta-lactamase class C family)